MMCTASLRFTPIIKLAWYFSTKSCRCSPRSVDRIHDPELIQQAPASTRFLVNQGALRNARYIYPVIGYRPIEGLELKLAYLMAFSAAGAIDPFQSGINGGYNLGLTESRYLEEPGPRTLSWRSVHGQRCK